MLTDRRAMLSGLADPAERLESMPRGPQVTQTEDVLVDRRGNVFITDKNQALGAYPHRPAPVLQEVST